MTQTQKLPANCFTSKRCQTLQVEQTFRPYPKKAQNVQHFSKPTTLSSSSFRNTSWQLPFLVQTQQQNLIVGHLLCPRERWGKCVVLETYLVER